MKVEVTNIKEVQEKNPSHIISVLTFEELKSLRLPRGFNKNNWLHLNINDVSDSNQHSGPCFSDMENLFSWLDKQENISHLIVHCFAGKSRSPAVGLLLMSRKFNVEYAIGWLKSELPDSYPNTEIVKLGDEYLNLSGKLLEEVEKFLFENFKKTYMLEF